MFNLKKLIQPFISAVIFLIVFNNSLAQFGHPIKWTNDGNGYYRTNAGNIVLNSLPDGKETVIVPSEKLIPQGSSSSLNIQGISFSGDNQKILIYTNSKKVWRYNTRGDYWVYNLSNNSLTQLGKTLPKSSLMFAKFSPDGTKAAYVSDHNLYVEDLSTNQIKQLTPDGNRKLI